MSSGDDGGNNAQEDLIGENWRAKMGVLEEAGKWEEAYALEATRRS